MTGKNHFHKIRVFVGVPFDADEERKCLETTINELNRPGGIIAQEGVELEIIEWSRFLEPYTGKNRAIDVEALPLEEWDLFVGTLRFRFDGPVSEDNGSAKDSGPKLGNYTEEVFDCAYNAWKKTGLPRLLLYRSHRSFSAPGIDINQVKHIQTFLDRFANHYRHPPFYKVFKETGELESYLRSDILAYMKEFGRHRALAMEAGKVETKVPGFDTPQEGQADSDVRETVFLRVDSLVHNPELREQPLDQVKLLLNTYRAFIEENITRHRGIQIYSDVKGSIWAFLGDALHDRAISAGIEVIAGHTEFIKSKSVLHLAGNLKPRLAAHCGAVDINSPGNRSYIRLKNYVTHLEQYHTPSGTFAVTDILYQALNNDLKKSLKYDKIYENETTYTYAGSYGKEPVSNTEIENLSIKIRDHAETLLENIEISINFPGTPPDPSDLRRYVARIYKNYDYLCRRASDYNKDWPEEYFKQVIKSIKSILEKEKYLYEKLEDLPVKLKGVNPTLLSIRDFAGSTRIYSISKFDLLLKQLEKVPVKDIEPDTILEEYIREKIAAFVEADDFNEETAFAELFLSPSLKEKLKTFIETQSHEPLYGELVSRFWKLADFVRIEDRDALPDKKILPLLTRKPQKGKNFKVLEQLLAKNSKPERRLIETLFQEQGIPSKDLKEMDINIVLKCILIDHAEPGVRQYVLNTIQFKELWNIIAYSRTPIETLKEIASYLSLSNEEDYMKVFFDLTLLRLVNSLFDPGFPEFLPHIKAIIEIFYKFDFFIESGYFRRLNDLTIRFKEKVEGNEIGILEESMKQLEKEYKEYKKTGSKDTSEIKIFSELPMAVQRKLARDGHYPDFFCTSTHKDIADEVYRYINSNNIAKYVSMTAINSRLLKKLLRQDEFFKKNSVINAALCNPKCTMDFATHHASKLTRSELQRLAANPNINPDIRNHIKNVLGRK